MYRSKFKDRAEAQAYYKEMLDKGKCSAKFQEHYAAVVQTIPYANAKTKIIKPLTLTKKQAIPYETDLSLKNNEILLGDGVVHISG